MAWTKFSHGFRLDPIAKTPPEALVVLVKCGDISLKRLTLIAERWAAAIPTTAFIMLSGVGQSRGAPLDRATQALDAILKHQLSLLDMDASRLVLVGFGHGGTMVLRLLFHKGWCCAGVLTFAAELMPPTPKSLMMNCKVRLICVEERAHSHKNLPSVIASLAEHGIDVRSALMNNPILSDECIRHGGCYLVELVATAQRGNPFKKVAQSGSPNRKKGDSHANA